MKVLQVNDLKKVDTTRYIEGDIFISKKQIAILHQGKVEPLVKQSELRDYIKKKDVQKLIDESIKKVTAE